MDSCTTTSYSYYPEQDCAAEKPFRNDRRSKWIPAPSKVGGSRPRDMLMPNYAGRPPRVMVLDRHSRVGRHRRKSQ